MKKVFALTISLLILSGCSLPAGKQVEESVLRGAPEDNNIAFSEQDLLEDINKSRGVVSLKNTARPDSSQKQEQGNKIELENLFSTYNQALIRTNFGNIKVRFYSESPLAVNNFMNLAQKGFYNGTKFHRVIKDFMIQGGDPNSKDDNWDDDGTGGPGYKFQDEINSHKLARGSLAMANSGPNTNGSQFFIVTKEATPWLDGKHTNFGEVVEGMETVDKIEAVKTNENSHPVEGIIIESIGLLSSKDNYKLGEEELKELENYNGTSSEEEATSTEEN
ncbi:hypothetical protein COT99_03725 [Candidatus Falkowbacteria bacterium CG10_big_fil_rev_8_21_14_0_10_43_10]|uniref:Peptidyl-prolyl cis-trans isomerase n=1 Tax=Candidatus Falkowbacteria bacterium CG10_big_fil_rev_8_21_14_0_10_43_10 TaxID=1974567 RepID=A0A2H0V1J5_9BACT|nr:MAG: hypothetical protein COT99_03725 [Candidatus Falkowbacteria bacterium CG10_big_fil_rev_8_21_14_0_10_43_10]